KLFFGSKYKKLIATENDSLIIGLTDSRILKIDLNRGEIIFNWHNVPGFNKSQFFKEVLPEADYFHFDSSRNNMIAFFASYIFEIDTESGDIKFENVKEKLEEHRFNSFKLCNSVNPKNESYLVTGHADLEKYPNVDLSGILSIKKSTLDIESSYIFEETGLGTNTVLSRDQDIFVKDLNNRLHWLKNC
ncbi:MAG: hypothetical protein J7F05_08940, partial [Trichodesmium erythraeum GBRTRLIN201]|nr:hypothetical protein [Trichodesmium erythraeum GBRTRLIN201]